MFLDKQQTRFPLFRLYDVHLALPELSENQPRLPIDLILHTPRLCVSRQLELRGEFVRRVLGVVFRADEEIRCCCRVTAALDAR